MINDSKILSILIDQDFKVDLSNFDETFLSTLVRNRLSLLGLKSIYDYILLVNSNQHERDNFIKSLNITYTEFFRNSLTFSYLKQFIMPLIIERKKVLRENEVRVWSAACSSGQEPYSVSMLFEDINQDFKKDVSCRIFATDINELELIKARKGTYSLPALSNVSLKQFDKYFVKDRDSAIISEIIRNSVDFSFFDLLSEYNSCPPASIYGNFDIVFCSNLLFYYKSDYRRLILDKVQQGLNIDGYLVTGESEREILLKYGFKEIYPYSSIFQFANKRR